MWRILRAVSVGVEPLNSVTCILTALRLIVRENLAAYRFPWLRHCVSAGEPLNPEVIETWKRATGLSIYEGYGQTEAGPVISANPPETFIADNK